MCTACSNLRRGAGGDAPWSKPATAALAHQEVRELLACAAHARIRARIASCQGSGTHTAVNSAARWSSVRLRASRRSVLIRRDRGSSNNDAPTRRQLASDAITAACIPSWPSLPASQRKFCRCVRDRAAVSQLADQTAFR
jgi:hypothetical protein